MEKLTIQEEEVMIYIWELYGAQNEAYRVG